MCTKKGLVVMTTMVMTTYNSREKMWKEMLEETCIYMKIKIGKEWMKVAKTCKYIEQVLKETADVMTCKQKAEEKEMVKAETCIYIEIKVKMKVMEVVRTYMYDIKGDKNDGDLKCLS